MTAILSYQIKELSKREGEMICLSWAQQYYGLFFCQIQKNSKLVVIAMWMMWLCAVSLPD